MVFESDGQGHLEAVPGALARRLRHLEGAQPGQASFDAQSYLGDLVACIDELHQGGQLEGVRAVGTDSQWHSVVAVGPDGAPVSEVLSWADTRPRWKGGRPDEDALEQLRQRTGAAFAPMYWTWRVPWLRDMGAVGERFLGLPEYVGLHLLGDPAMSVSMASGTGLLRTAGHRWDDEALALAGLRPSELPEVAAAGWTGTLGPKWARRWPQLAGARWHPALGDGAAANLGVGCNAPDRAALTVGTSAAVRAVRPSPGPAELPAGLWRYCIDRDRVVVGAAYSSGGQLYSWALALWEGTSTGVTGLTAGAASHAGGVSHEVRYDVPAPVGAGSDGVVVLPWHAGTRPPAAPVPAGQGCVIGLGLGHGGGHIVSAAVEAVCFQLADGLSQLESGVGETLQLVVNGGAIERSPWWQCRLAGALGRAVTVSAVPETTARGAAAEALGVDLAGDHIEGQRVEPDASEVEALKAANKRWAELYGHLLPVMGGH
jgi:gluconokinase